MQQDPWRQVVPVLLSILIIVAVAIIRNYSKTLAAITATMPLTIPLSLWIIYAGAVENHTGAPDASLRQFIDTLPFGIFGTVAFIFAVWLTSRAGWRLLPMIVAGYVAWGVTLGLLLVIRQALRL